MTIPLGWGHPNPHCTNCGDERGGPHGHNTTECAYRPGMTSGEVAKYIPADRRAQYWADMVDRYMGAQAGNR